MTVRVRFAPSPTGFLHIGGVRTALFNWLYARHHKGQFLLRIEDTDLERSEDKYTQDILSSMQWLGLDWDEEPLFQSKRLEVYAQKTEELIQKGHAYRCTCTEADVEKMRERLMAEGKKPMYDRSCRDKNLPAKPGVPYVVRAKVPLTGYIEFDDLIRGPIRVENQEVDDFVLIRSSGAPTYNLSVVIDDVHSQMTHIIRGDDHINNTPKQIHLYQYLGYAVPRFAHLPMILGQDKKKLSKRHGAVSANIYRADGFLPEALLNFLVRLGWSHGDQEVFSIDELIQFFEFDHVQKASGVFNTEKLLWLNGEYIKKSDPARLSQIVFQDFSESFRAPAQVLRVDSDIMRSVIVLLQSKVKTIKELAELLIPLCTPGAIEVDPSQLKWNKDANLKTSTQAAVAHVIRELDKKVNESGKTEIRGGGDAIFGFVPSLKYLGLGHQEIDAYLRQVGEQYGVKLGDLVAPMRLVLTGKSSGASVFELMALFPWDFIKTRLDKVQSL